MARIVFNGKEYESVDRMPADADGSGVPDVAEGEGAVDFSTEVRAEIVIDGRTYESVDEMPAHLRRVYEQAMAEESMRAGRGTAVSPLPGGSPAWSAGSGAGRLLLRLAAAGAAALLLWWLLGLVRSIL